MQPGNVALPLHERGTPITAVGDEDVWEGHGRTPMICRGWQMDSG